MSLPVYARYKATTAEWLGDVPAHWTVCALGYRYDIALGKMLDAKQITGHNLAPYLRNGDVQWGRINTYNLPRMDFDADDALRFGLQKGDLLVCEGGDVGRAAIWQGQIELCYYQKALHRVRPQSRRDVSTFLFYALRAAVDRGIFSAEGGKATIAHLPAESFRRYRFVFPPVEEQLAITAFLDRETAKIDALIAEQEKLLALLAEKRQATISHAVARGLNPNAPMKDSGIPWLGEVPAGWEVVMLRRVVLGFEQGWSPECEGRLAESGEWGVLKAGCVNGGQFRPEEHKALPDSLEPRADLEVRAGDVLMSRASGSPQLIGSVACVESPPSHLMLSDKVFRLRLSPDVRGNFFALAMRSASMRAQIEQAIGGAEGLASNLSQARIKDFWLALPAEHVQREIEQYVEQALNRFDALERQTNQSIDLLRERRSALISAAITGKIDVRNAVPAEELVA